MICSLVISKCFFAFFQQFLKLRVVIPRDFSDFFRYLIEDFGGSGAERIENLLASLVQGHIGLRFCQFF